MKYTEEEVFSMSDEEAEAALQGMASESEDPSSEAPVTAEEESNSDGEVIQEVNEQEENESEHPVSDEPTDSGHNSNEGETTKEEANAIAEVGDQDQEGTPDQSPAADNTEEASSKEEDPKLQPVQLHKFRANGKEYEFSDEEMREKFPTVFGQAMDYTKKAQALKPWRKTMDALEAEGLSHEDVSLMIDVLKGDKAAISSVLDRTGVDALDLGTEDTGKYVANDYGRDESALAIKDIVDSISQDAEYTTTSNILTKEWDERSWSEMSSNPDTIRALHVDVKSGMYNTVQPIAEKLKVYDGARKSDLDYYKEASQQYFSQLDRVKAETNIQEQLQAEAQARAEEQRRLDEVRAEQTTRSNVSNAATKRKAAAPPKSRAGAGKQGAVDYLNASDAEFEAWMRNLE